MSRSARTAFRGTRSLPAEREPARSRSWSQSGSQPRFAQAVPSRTRPWRCTPSTPNGLGLLTPWNHRQPLGCRASAATVPDLDRCTPTGPPAGAAEWESGERGSRQHPRGPWPTRSTTMPAPRSPARSQALPSRSRSREGARAGSSEPGRRRNQHHVECEHAGWFGPWQSNLASVGQLALRMSSTACTQQANVAHNALGRPKKIARWCHGTSSREPVLYKAMHTIVPNSPTPAMTNNDTLTWCVTGRRRRRMPPLLSQTEGCVTVGDSDRGFTLMTVPFRQVPEVGPRSANLGRSDCWYPARSPAQGSPTAPLPDLTSGRQGRLCMVNHVNREDRA